MPSKAQLQTKLADQKARLKAVTEAKEREVKKQKEAEAVEQAKLDAERKEQNRIRKQQTLEREKQQALERESLEQKQALEKVEQDRKQKEQDELLAKIPLIEEELALMKKGLKSSPSPFPLPSEEKGIPQNSQHFKILLLGKFADQHLDSFGFLKGLSYNAFRWKERGTRLVQLIPDLELQVGILDRISRNGVPTFDTILFKLKTQFSGKKIPINVKELVKDLGGDLKFEGQFLYEIDFHKFRKKEYTSRILATFPEIDQELLTIIEYFSHIKPDFANPILELLSKSNF